MVTFNCEFLDHGTANNSFIAPFSQCAVLGIELIPLWRYLALEEGSINWKPVVGPQKTINEELCPSNSIPRYLWKRVENRSSSR